MGDGAVTRAAADDLAGEIRQLLAEITGDPAPLTAPPDTPLLRDGLGLDSLAGTILLTEVHRRYGVDVADEDLNLDSLASIGSLASFVSARSAAPGRPR
jgi:acyl carrier protein